MLECRAESQGRGQVIKGMTASEVARLLVVCGVGNEKCRGQVTRLLMMLFIGT